MNEKVVPATLESVREGSQPMDGRYAEALLKELATWTNTTTIILHGGCVFEFKGRFPEGTIGHGFYNLGGEAPGFQGHIHLEAIKHIAFQDRPHRGRESYAFNFMDSENQNIFKVFLGRDQQGELLQEQVSAFKRIRSQLHLW